MAILHGLDKVRKTLGNDAITEASPGDYSLLNFCEVLELSLSRSNISTHEKKLTLLLTDSEYPGHAICLTLDGVTEFECKTNLEHSLALEDVSKNQWETIQWRLYEYEDCIGDLRCYARTASLELVSM